MYQSGHICTYLPWHLHKKYSHTAVLSSILLAFTFYVFDCSFFCIFSVLCILFLHISVFDSVPGLFVPFGTVFCLPSRKNCAIFCLNCFIFPSICCLVQHRTHRRHPFTTKNLHRIPFTSLHLSVPHIPYYSNFPQFLNRLRSSLRICLKLKRHCRLYPNFCSPPTSSLCVPSITIE